MNYWLDLFTVQTYEEFQKAGAKVSGFRERQWTSVPAHPARGQAALLPHRDQPVGRRLTGHQARLPLRGAHLGHGGVPRSPPVEAEILLPPEHGIPHQTLSRRFTHPPDPGRVTSEAARPGSRRKTPRPSSKRSRRRKQTPVLAAL